MRPRIILALAASVALSAAPTAEAAGLVLERAVVVERHGVRSPTKPPEALSKFSAEPWPAWPVGVGELTPHGADNVRLMGAWMASDYRREGLAPSQACPAPGEVYVWADGQDQRTRMSGQAWLDGAFPGCGLVAAHGPEGQQDDLFDAGHPGACPIDADAAKAVVLARVEGGDLDHPRADYAAARAALAHVLAPGAAPCSTTDGACFLSGANTLDAKGDGLKLSGPLGTGATLTESLLLEYAQGMPAAEVGWGRAGSEAAIASVIPLHEIDSDLMRRTPYIAGRNAARLARAIAGAVAGEAALPGQTKPARLALIAGHDTNIANLSGVLGVDWTLPGQPDKTPPDGALAFEVWKDSSGGRFVKVAMVYQTLAQLRQATPLDAAHPAGRVDLPLPGCDDRPERSCPVARFEARVKAAVPAECWN
jgi:4-phytase/acid phosphatase